jgi:hypothetical protein
MEFQPTALGDDILDGGPGTDWLVETGDVNLTLTSTSLVGLGSDALLGLESAVLTGGASANSLDASDTVLGSGREIQEDFIFSAAWIDAI